MEANMKSYRFLVYFLVISLVLLPSCTIELKRPASTEKTNKTSEVTSTSTASTEATETEVTESEATETVPSETESEPVDDFPNYLDFSDLLRHATVMLDSNYETPGMIRSTALFDISGDGVADQIQLDVNETTCQGNLSVNGVSLTMYIDYFAFAFLMDIDRAESHYDLFIYDRGPSEDPVFHVYRYDGTSIRFLGDLYGTLSADREGRIISSVGTSWHVSPYMVFSWTEIVNGTIVVHPVDRTRYIGQTFRFRSDIVEYGSVWLSETTTIPAYDAFLYGPTPTDIYVRGGTRFTILDLSDCTEGNSPNWYYVRLEDGRTAVFYYMKGD